MKYIDDALALLLLGLALFAPQVSHMFPTRAENSFALLVLSMHFALRAQIDLLREKATHGRDDDA